MHLREYQKKCIESIYNEIKKLPSALVVAATGSGKTVVFVKFIEFCFEKMRRFRKDETFRVMILVHKVDLVTQTQEKLNQFAKHLNISIYCGSLNKKELDSEIIIGSIDSIKKHDLKINLLIVDEYHRFHKRKSYHQYKAKLLEINPKLKSCYFTATPYAERGYVYGEDEEIKKPCFEIGMTELIKQGHLVKPIFSEGKDKYDTSELRRDSKGEFVGKDLLAMVTSNPDKIKRQVASAIEALNSRSKTIWCCTSIEHAEQVEVELMAHGERVVCVHSKKPIVRQAELVDAFSTGSINHLVSVTKLSEGTDIPCIDSVVCMRPTRSPTLYVQMIGRGLRPHEGKEDCLFLDYGDVVASLGHPSNPHIRKKRDKKTDTPKAIICPACRSLNFAPISNCESCGYDYLKDEREVDRLKALNLLPYDPKRDNKIAVISWHVDWQYRSKKTGKAAVLIRYQTLAGLKMQYITRNHINREYGKFLNEHGRGKPDYVIVNESNNAFVKTRIYKDD